MANFYGSFIGFGAGGEAAETFHGGGSAYGYCVGGYTNSPTGSLNVIQKFLFASNANATDVGDLRGLIQNNSGASSTTHGYTAGGSLSPQGQIDKFSFTTDGNSTDVADLTLVVWNSGSNSY